MRAHDTHHVIPNSNYGQYIMLWDHLMGTFRHHPLDVGEEVREHNRPLTPSPSGGALAGAGAQAREGEGGGGAHAAAAGDAAAVQPFGTACNGGEVQRTPSVGEALHKKAL